MATTTKQQPFKLHYCRSLPIALIVEKEDGSLWISNTLEIKPIDETQLTPFYGHRESLFSVPDYMTRFYLQSR